MKSLVPKGTQALPSDEVMAQEYKILMARSGRFQPEYLDIVLVASRYGMRYLGVKAVIDFLRWAV